MAHVGAERVLLVSGDSHVGPKLETLREYCPQRYLEQFDEHLDSPDGADDAPVQVREPQPQDRGPPRRGGSPGRHGGDGSAAEVIFHNSFNGEPMRFIDPGWPDPDDPDLATLGLQIYNRWLADFCGAAPHRLIGPAHVPLWDLDATLAEVEWAADRGFRGINFSATRPGWKQYDTVVGAALGPRRGPGLVLTTHAGGGADPTSARRGRRPCSSSRWVAR